MDKTQCINTQVRSRDGFALMITLSVLSVIIALTMVLLSYFEEVQQDASDTKALIQADLYYTDIAAIFNGLKEEDKKILFSMLYSTVFPLNTEDGRFSLMLQCEPMSKGVNINWLGLETGNKFEVAQELFDALAQEYNIEDADRLLEMLYAEIGSKENLMPTRQSRLHQKNGIISYRQFADILSRYQFEVDDPDIGTIPWKKFFSFFTKSEKLDIEYSSSELIAYLFEIDISVVKEWKASVDQSRMEGLTPEPLETFVNSYNNKYVEMKTLFAGKEFLKETQCSVRYALGGEYYRFTFEYIEGGTKHFEFYGKQ